jgi:hypothetical protein
MAMAPVGIIYLVALSLEFSNSDRRYVIQERKQLYLGCVWFGFWLWLLPPKNQKSNQRTESGN